MDPEKIGIIGFSRTCFYVMETLTDWLASPQSCLDHRRLDGRLFSVYTDGCWNEIRAKSEFDDRCAALR